MITDSELLEIEERANKASPGPWTAYADIRPDVVVEPIRIANHELQNIVDKFLYLQKKHAITHPDASIYSESDSAGYCGDGQIVREMHKYIGHICELAKYYGPEINIPGDYGYETSAAGNCTDAEFIAHARSDIPALIAEVKRLKTLIKESGKDI